MSQPVTKRSVMLSMGHTLMNPPNCLMDLKVLCFLLLAFRYDLFSPFLPVEAQLSSLAPIL